MVSRRVRDQACHRELEGAEDFQTIVVWCVTVCGIAKGYPAVRNSSYPDLNASSLQLMFMNYGYLLGSTMHTKGKTINKRFQVNQVLLLQAQGKKN